MGEKQGNLGAARKQDLVTRRRFIAGAGAAAFSFAVVKPRLVRGTEANSKVKLGLIGCGGRGTWIAGLFKEHGGYEIVGAAEYFQDRVDAFGEKFNLEPARRYSGLSGYRRLLEQKVDAVAIESPPYFHPEQAAAAVDAGCHVYLAKPIAVDVQGCHSVAESGKKATAGKLCFLVDFQTRANELYQEAIKRVHDGAIGRFAFGEASYHANATWGGQEEFLRDDPANPENRLRAWGLDRVFSGDIITEQNIHTLDVASWIMDQPPISAVGIGGQKVRRVGTCWDCFTLVFEYPDKVGVTFSSKQFKGHGAAGGIRNRMFGSKGVLETEYGGTVLIRGENFYRGGQTTDIYKQGAVNNIATFYSNITGGQFDNPTVAPSVRSNLVTILGRTAAYAGEKLYWDKLIKSTEKWQADLRGLKS
ncbi:MAG TPA: Gfo/Idh/MocA family oxidoreductase [Sedimentisphaerales bacterium]|nr:Gfo/Idh/MocA family oxidoreductase [Sedimentisphaerales bacterium]